MRERERESEREKERNCFVSWKIETTTELNVRNARQDINSCFDRRMVIVIVLVHVSNTN